MESACFVILTLIMYLQFVVTNNEWNIIGIIVSMLTLLGFTIGTYVKVKTDIAKMKTIHGAIIADANNLREEIYTKADKDETAEIKTELQRKMDREYCHDSMSSVAKSLEALQKTAADNNQKIFEIYKVIVEKQ